ncbi:hypothetical protein J7J18_05150 [bacterium]|nr:hypothetical protein [bacterium]
MLELIKTGGLLKRFLRKYAMEVVLRMINELMAGRVRKNGKELLDEKIDFLETFNLDPEEIIPSDEEIEKIREKIGKLAQKAKI